MQEEEKKVKFPQLKSEIMREIGEEVLNVQKQNQPVLEVNNVKQKMKEKLR